MLVYGLLDPFMTRECWVALTAGLFMLGAWACERSGRDIGVVDHGGFVIDEVVAVWAVCIMLPAGWGWWLVYAWALIVLLSAAWQRWA